MSDEGIDIDNHDLDGLIDDLRGLVGYLTNVPLESMRSHELQDWRDRLETVRDFLRGVEIKHPDNGEDGDWDGDGGCGEGEDEVSDEEGQDDESGADDEGGG